MTLCSVILCSMITTIEHTCIRVTIDGVDSSAVHPALPQSQFFVPVFDMHDETLRLTQIMTKEKVKKSKMVQVHVPMPTDRHA